MFQKFDVKFTNVVTLKNFEQTVAEAAAAATKALEALEVVGALKDPGDAFTDLPNVRFELFIQWRGPEES